MTRERKLASIQKIIKIEPIPEADRIELASVLGWKVVVQKGMFHEGDSVIYIEIDSVCPNIPAFADVYKYSNGKVRTAKMRGVFSQGFPLPISSFIDIVGRNKIVEWAIEHNTIHPDIANPPKMHGVANDFPSMSWQFTDDILAEGTDVTELLGIVKYEKPIPEDMKDIILNDLPANIFKTDEPRVQANPQLLVKYHTVHFYATEKVDGESSCFYWYDGHFGVGSRIVEFKDHPKVPQWKVAHELELPEKMSRLNRNIALQGELLGEGVQGNKYKIKGHCIKFFTAFDINTSRYLGWTEMLSLLRELGLEDHIVPVLADNYTLPDTVDALEQYVETENNGFSRVNPQTKREGIVFRAIVEQNDAEIGRLSFKCVSKSFLVKIKDE